MEQEQTLVGKENEHKEVEQAIFNLRMPTFKLGLDFGKE